MFVHANNMKMVSTRGKKKSASSDATLEETEASINGLAKSHFGSPTVDVTEPNEDAHLEEKLESITDKARNENLGEISGDEGEKGTEVDNEDPSVPVTETNGDIEAELEKDKFEDDDIDDREDVEWNDELELDNEDRVLDDYGVSEEETTEEDDEDDDFSEDEAAEEDEVSEEEITKEGNVKENAEQNTRETKIKDDERETKVKQNGSEAKKHDIERLEASLKNIKRSNERSGKKKVQAGRLKKVNSEDKPESSRKRKVKKRVQSMGMIFMCNSETKKDCYQHRILGLPESKKDIVEKIYTGMRLFLYDFDLKLMYGIYRAAGPGGYNIEPKAFKSQFPSQVRFRVLENCLPLAEEKFKDVIKENYTSKSRFDCQLNSEQVKKLCRLFTASSKGRPSKALGVSPKAEKHPVRPERRRRQRAGNKKRPPLREEARHHERPRKRPRKVMSPSPPPRKRLPPPLSSTIPPPYVYNRASDVDSYRRKPYIERRSPYRDRRDRPLIPVDPYGGARDPHVVGNERYRDGRDPPLERHYAYNGGRDSHLERRDPYIDEIESYPRKRNTYRDERAPYLESRDPYRDGQGPFMERRDIYREGRDPYIERHDSLRDGRASYLEHHVPYGESAQYELYSSTYRRPLLSDSRDLYRVDQVVDLRDSYRRDELLGRRDQHPIDLQTRNRHDIAGRDAYVSSRERPSYTEAFYPAAYPPRAGLYRL